MAFGTDPTPQGLADPPIDDLMEHADSKYALAIFAAKRARQINSYFTQLNEGLLQNVGPLVEYQNQEKPLSIAFREIDSGRDVAYEADGRCRALSELGRGGLATDCQKELTDE